MELTRGKIIIKNIAATLGLIQGLAWTSMSLICIILYNTGNPTLNGDSYMEVLGSTIYKFFLLSNTQKFANQTMTGTIFSGFMWVHFVLNIAWTGLSVKVMYKNKSKPILAWTLLTLIISCWDFTTVIVLGADYHKCLHFCETLGRYNNITCGRNCADAILPVLVIAAKGFVLWITNVFLAIILPQIS